MSTTTITSRPRTSLGRAYALCYLAGSVSFVATRCVVIGYHRLNAGAPLLTQSEFGRTYHVLMGESLS